MDANRDNLIDACREIREKHDLSWRHRAALAWIIGILMITSGCSSMKEMHGYEVAFHAMNVIDTGQTIHIAREPSCYKENTWPMTDMWGDHPSETEVYLTMAAVGLAYHYTNRWLDSKVDAAEPGTQKQGNWYMTRAAFNGLALVSKFITIRNNADIELTPWGRGCY